MPKVRSPLIITFVVIFAFISGVAVAGWYFYGWVQQSTEDMLIDRTNVLQYMRTGDIKFAEQHVESIAWNQIISIGNRVADGHSVTARAREAVTYHCSQFSKQKSTMASKLAEERTYWCECVLTGHCIGSPSASAER